MELDDYNYLSIGSIWGPCRCPYGGSRLTRIYTENLTDSVTKKGYDYQELVEEGYWLFYEPIPIIGLPKIL
jgi:hypothetical protein